MKRILLSILLLSGVSLAQLSSTGTITTSGATCAVNNACIVMGLYNTTTVSTGSASIVISGTFTGTIQFEASTDGVNFGSIPGIPLAGGASVTSVTGTGTWTFGVSALSYLRARASAFASGTATVTIQASEGAPTSTGSTGTISGSVSITGQPISVTTPTTDPCASSGVAKSSVPINISAAGTSALIAVSGSTVIYVCGFTATISQVATTANTLQFGYSTVAACASGVTALTGLYGAGGVTAAAPILITTDNSGTVFKTPASNGLCVITAIGASGSFQGVLSYVQQ